MLASSVCLQLLLQMNPSHVDSLLQLSDVCRMQEDQEMARDLVGKKLRAARVEAGRAVLCCLSCSWNYGSPQNGGGSLEECMCSKEGHAFQNRGLWEPYVSPASNPEHCSSPPGMQLFHRTPGLGSTFHFLFRVSLEGNRAFSAVAPHL